MEAKVPPATCFPDNKNAKRILRRSDAHPHTPRNTRFFCASVSYEMSNIIRQCQMTSCVVAVVGSLWDLVPFSVNASSLFCIQWLGTMHRS